MKSIEQDAANLNNYPVKEDKSWTIAVTRGDTVKRFFIFKIKYYIDLYNNNIDRRIEKESLKEYINKKREMFLVQVISL